MKIVVSACLLGRNCKYNGGNNRNERVIEYVKDKDVIEVCPEMLGGLDELYAMFHSDQRNRVSITTFGYGHPIFMLDHIGRRNLYLVNLFLVFDALLDLGGFRLIAGSLLKMSNVDLLLAVNILHSGE